MFNPCFWKYIYQIARKLVKLQQSDMLCKLTSKKFKIFAQIKQHKSLYVDKKIKSMNIFKL